MSMERSVCGPCKLKSSYHTLLVLVDNRSDGEENERTVGLSTISRASMKANPHMIATLLFWVVLSYGMTNGK